MLMADSSATNRWWTFPPPAEREPHAVATPSTDFYWASAYVRRFLGPAFASSWSAWRALDDPTRATSLAKAPVTILYVGGALRTADYIAAYVLPDSVEYSVHWAGHYVPIRKFRRTVRGPSPLDDVSPNATVQSVEDPLLSGKFLADRAAAVAAIERLGRLPANWDSYGGKTIDSAARRAAVRFLAMLHVVAPTSAPPVVGPSSRGSVLLQWFVGTTEVFVEVDEAGVRYDVSLEGQEAFVVEGAQPPAAMGDAAGTIAPYVRPL